jgi:hypothetical protein
MRRLVVPFGVFVLAVVALALAERAPAAEAATPAGTMDVTVREGRLSVNLRDAPLGDVLRLIGQEAHLKVNLDGQFGTPITATFTGLPLEAGIRRLTREHSSSFAYGPPPQPGLTGRLTEIWIVGSVPAAQLMPPRAPRDWRMWVVSLGGGTMGRSRS